MVAEEATSVESARAGDRWVEVAGGLTFAVFGAAIVLIGQFTLREDIQGDLLGPKAFPWMLGSSLFVGGLYVALRAWRLPAAQVEAALESEGDEDEPGVPSSLVRAAAVMGLALLYTVVLDSIGYLIATPLFVAAGLYALAMRSKVGIIAVSLLLTAFCYYVFAEVLSVPLPSGLLTGPLRALGWAR
jgi:putative tricarboxylic transport membrane protein